jgi:hypothetical protein
MTGRWKEAAWPRYRCRPTVEGSIVTKKREIIENKKESDNKTQKEVNFSAARVGFEPQSQQTSGRRPTP